MAYPESSVMHTGGDWEQSVPRITGTRGYAGVCMPESSSTERVQQLARMHDNPSAITNPLDLARRATTARPLVLGRTNRGTWLVLHLATLEVLGIGENRKEALEDARSHDRTPKP